MQKKLKLGSESYFLLFFGQFPQKNNISPCQRTKLLKINKFDQK